MSYVQLTNLGKFLVHPIMKKQKILSAGFTLVEVATVVLIGGLLLEAGIAMLNNYLKSSRISATKQRMSDIDTAIGQYLKVNGVLPCPAPLNVKPDTATFGRSLLDGVAANTLCSSQATTLGIVGTGVFIPQGTQPPAALTPANNNLNVVIGAVPVRSLNLPDQEIADAWGDNFVYAVTDYLTPYNSNPALSQGVIDVRDGNDNPLVGATFTPPLYAQYVVVSYGSDRVGSYTMDGGQVGVPCPALVATGGESTNCTFNSSPMKFRNTMQVSTQAGNNYFDDYVIYHTNLGVSANTATQWIVLW